jgi:DNA-binding response OmpR family regulator
MGNETILLVDDDLDMLHILKMYLRKEGFTVQKTMDGDGAIRHIKKDKPDLIILDVMMPRLNGFELCRMIRRITDVPVLFFSSKDADTDQIAGLAIGGDDYLPKSTSLPVVTAKVKALLRRTSKQSAEKGIAGSVLPDTAVLEFPGLVIKLDSAVVEVNGSAVKLSAKEYRILCILAQNPDRIYSVEQLFELVWGEESLGDHRTVMVHISNLRRKIDPSSDGSKYIHTFRGIGYKFNGAGD